MLTLIPIGENWSHWMQEYQRFRLTLSTSVWTAATKKWSCAIGALPTWASDWITRRPQLTIMWPQLTSWCGLLPVKVSSKAVNMAASVSYGSSGKCVCVRVWCRVDLCVYGCLVVWWSLCVCVGQQFLLSLWGSCAGAKYPAAHRCLFTGWFTALTGKTHTRIALQEFSQKI